MIISRGKTLKKEKKEGTHHHRCYIYNCFSFLFAHNGTKKNDDDDL